mmetsp:Transcript_34926/g.75545  ORF Transcript_34926/g.75545 Transcript_34926/m.75545 type:complete len:324 (+) Transcript_34926:514-1485(+)
MAVGVADLLVQKLSDGALELRRDLLRFVRHVHLRHLCFTIRLDDASQQFDESRLAGSVLTKHDDDLTVVEVARVDVKGEGGSCLWLLECLGHERVSGHAVLLVFRVVQVRRLGHLEGERCLSETKVLGGNETSEENVDALADGERHGHDTVVGGRAVENADEVTEVVQHGEIVLHADNVRRWGEKTADAAGSLEALLDVEVGGGLVEHVDIGVLNRHNANGETLELSTGKIFNGAVEHLHQVQELRDLFQVVALGLGLQDAAHDALDRTGDVVNILGLDDRLEVVLENPLEIALQLGATEVGENILPIRRSGVTAEVGLQLSG